MDGSLIRDAFAHHVWATLRLIDACQDLGPEQLETAPPGTYGSIIDTLRHLVVADASYLEVVSGEVSSLPGPDGMSLAELRDEVERHGQAWDRLLERELDPDVLLVRHRPDGSETHAPLGIRLAQALHHGSDHRSQVCTALSTLGLDPPAIDVWDFGREQGRVIDVRPT